MAAVVRSSGFLDSLVKRYSKYKINRLRLSKYAEFAKSTDKDEARLLSCKFIHNEGPVRLAHMISEMQALPAFMLQQPLLRTVHSWYLDSFRDLVDLPHIDSTSRSDVTRYTAQMEHTLQRILRRHAPVVVTVAHGLKQMKNKGMLEGLTEGVTEFQERFYMSRIGIRFLFNQHLSLFGADQSGPHGWAGSIDPNCSVARIAEDAISNAAFLCDQRYLASPPVRIVTPGGTANDITFTYVPSHLYHILFELMKNAMRAVVERHGETGNYPEVRLAIVKGHEDMTIKISDEGGGMSHRHIKEAFKYFYSTAPPPQSALSDSEVTNMTDMNYAPLAGLGVGLPVSRLYARYFGGDLDLISIDSFGTDAYVYLRAAAQEAVEVLPTYSQGEISYTDKLEAARESRPHWLKSQPATV